jgi:hypothetical protein
LNSPKTRTRRPWRPPKRSEDFPSPLLPPLPAPNRYYLIGAVVTYLHRHCAHSLCTTISISSVACGISTEVTVTTPPSHHNHCSRYRDTEEKVKAVHERVEDLDRQKEGGLPSVYCLSSASFSLPSPHPLGGGRGALSPIPCQRL